MKTFRTREPRAWSGASQLFDFSLERWKRSGRLGQTVFYINDKGTWLETLSENRSLSMLDIHSLETLSNSLFQFPPDLVLIESSLSWADPLILLESLTSTLSAPTVMVCEKNVRNRSWLKKAFALGASDVLFAPREKEDLFQTLSVLLRFQERGIG